MDENRVGLGPLEGANGQGGAIESGQEDRKDAQILKSGAKQVRAARARVIEETAYRLTDILTTISGRIEILSDRAPSTCREELMAIRRVAMKGANLNQRLLLAAQECRSEIGL